MLNGNELRKQQPSWEWEKSNEVTDYYPTISAQKNKKKQPNQPTNKII